MSVADFQREYRLLKGALTRAERSGKPEWIIEECEAALARFDVIGWPDDWSRWERAKNDAELKLRYA